MWLIWRETLPPKWPEKMGVLNVDSLLNADYPSKSLHSKLMLGILLTEYPADWWDWYIYCNRTYSFAKEIKYTNVGRHIQSSHGSYEICFSLLDCMRSQFLDPQKWKRLPVKGDPFQLPSPLLIWQHPLLDGYFFSSGGHWITHFEGMNNADVWSFSTNFHECHL